MNTMPGTREWDIEHMSRRVRYDETHKLHEWLQELGGAGWEPVQAWQRDNPAVYEDSGDGGGLTCRVVSFTYEVLVKRPRRAEPYQRPLDAMVIKREGEKP